MNVWVDAGLAVDPPAAGHASNLVYTDTYALMPQGQRWQSYVQAIQPQVNLLPWEVPGVVADIPPAAESVTVTISATLVNNGNTAPTGAIVATFYSNALLTETIGSATFSGLGGCAWHEVVVTTTWSALGPGVHPFWVQVDSSRRVAETDETDNVAQGVVLVAPHRLFLPVALR